MLRRFSLGLALLATLATQVGAQSLELMSNTPLALDDVRFGGLSALEMENGEGALTVSDRGIFFDLTFIRNDDGNLVDVQAKRADYVPTQRDTEGLAIDSSGAYMSLEGPAMARIINGTALPKHVDFRRFKSNGGLEALAIDDKGRLYTLGEQKGDAHDPLGLYVLEWGHWFKRYRLPRRNRFLPVGADFGPDGLFYLLERSFSPLGFRTQIRRFDLNQEGLDEVILLRTRPLAFGNLEGMAVWRDPLGDIRLTLISDDNFNPFQHNQIVEYRLID